MSFSSTEDLELAGRFSLHLEQSQESGFFAAPAPLVAFLSLQEDKKHRSSWAASSPALLLHPEVEK